MAARLESVAKYICEKGDWEVSNLRLQKILYMAQMYHMGQNDGKPLCEAKFQAWDYGPVEPTLYKRVRMFGSGAIENVFSNARNFNKGDARRDILDQVCKALLPLSAGELVSITHWPKGAWARNYVPSIRGIPIPDADIAAEFAARAAANHTIGA